MEDNIKNNVDNIEEKPDNEARRDLMKKLIFVIPLILTFKISDLKADTSGLPDAPAPPSY